MRSTGTSANDAPAIFPGHERFLLGALFRKNQTERMEKGDTYGDTRGGTHDDGDDDSGDGARSVEDPPAGQMGWTAYSGSSGRSIKLSAMHQASADGVE